MHYASNIKIFNPFVLVLHTKKAASIFFRGFQWHMQFNAQMFFVIFWVIFPVVELSLSLLQLLLLRQYMRFFRHYNFGQYIQRIFKHNTCKVHIFTHLCRTRWLRTVACVFGALLLLLLLLLQILRLYKSTLCCFRLPPLQRHSTAIALLFLTLRKKLLTIVRSCNWRGQYRLANC